MNGIRSVRTRPRNGLAISDVLTATLLSELCRPSAELWVVTGWITDIPVLNNRHRQYDAVLGPLARSSVLLSEVLAEIAHRGTHIHVAVREVDHNLRFVRRIEGRIAAEQLSVHSSPDLHEKIMVGDDWVMKGSMNFTWNGVQVNEESIDFELSQGTAAKQRLELRTRWIGANHG